MALNDEVDLGLMAKIEDIPEEVVESSSSSASTSATQDKGIWYMDSGCSRHMTGNKFVHSLTTMTKKVHR